MKSPGYRSSFVIRVIRTKGHEHLTLQNLHTGKLSNFQTWVALLDYLNQQPKRRGLK